MDLQTIFTVGIVLFLIVMMRCCGGMGRGKGCGSGNDESCETKPGQPGESRENSESK